MNSETKEKLSKLFKTCHALAIHNRPFTDYNWLCQLDGAKGVKIGKPYRNSESAKEFTKAIAQVERKSLASAVKTAKFVSVLSDGSTNSAVCEQEMFFLRYVEDGMPVVKFAASVQVERSDSASILNAMQKAVAHYLEIPCNVFFSKLVGLGCDGASNMTGHRNGLIALLQKEQPSVIVVHCFAHRLELAFKDASKSNSLYEKVVATLLMGLYYFYHKSTVNRSMLKRCSNSLQRKVRMPTRVGGTRWVGHLHRALESVISSYPVIILHLQQVKFVRFYILYFKHYPGIAYLDYLLPIIIIYI